MKREHLNMMLEIICVWRGGLCVFFLTSEVELFYGFSSGGLLVLVVGDAGVFKHKPVLLVWSQCQSLRPGVGEIQTKQN